MGEFMEKALVWGYKRPPLLPLGQPHSLLAFLPQVYYNFLITGKEPLMPHEIPSLNLFMMCEQPRQAAFRPLPMGFHLRLCTPQEVPLWGKMNVDDPSSPTYMADYFAQVYAPRQEEFFRRCTFLCTEAGQPVATCFLWPAYGGRLHTLHWFKVLPEYEGQGLGRALLTCLLQDLPQGERPLYLHTHPSCFRAVGLYADFGFSLLSGPRVGSRQNDLEESLPYLRAAMPPDIFARLHTRPAPAQLLEAAALTDYAQF